MALATLCHALSKDEEHRSKFAFKAFIVDHKARDNSREEARVVAERVRSYFGIQKCIDL